jgi:hypothetical protein
MPEDLVVDKSAPSTKTEKFDDDTDLLNNLLIGKDKEEPEDDEDEEVEEDDLLDDKEDKTEEDEEEESEDDLITDENTRGLDLKKIKAKYPDFARTNEFRELRQSYYREAEYTKVFPTVEDAKEAAENNETFIKLNDALVNNGDALTLFNAIKEASPESVKKLAGNFLDSLAKYDQGLFQETISPVIKRAARQLNAQGKAYLKRNAESEEGQALVATARNIMEFYFEDGDLVDKNDDTPRVDTKLSEKEKELTNREQAIEQQRYQEAFGLVYNSTIKHIDKQILDKLDPDNRFSEFTRDALLEKIKNEVMSQVSKDQLHTSRMNSLWKRAQQSGYSRESLSRIVSAYLERARPIIPGARNKFRGIALKDKDQKEEKNESVKVANSGRSGRAPARDGKSPRIVDPKKVDYKNTSDDDILSGNVKMRA